jgi:GxxExxY protein
MDTDENKLINTDKLLHADLTYRIRKCIYNVANKYGKGLKESIYQKALAEEFEIEGLYFEQQKRIKIYSLETGKELGFYVPDFIVEDAVIIEIKATDFTIEKDIDQQLSYLKASRFEVGLLVNFNTPRLFIKRLIYTNDRKPGIRVNQ